MTSALSIKDGSSTRRLDPAEVIEVLEGPVKEEETGVLRVRCKAMKDDADGWVTLTGSQGTTFLEEGGNVFKVIKETILTDSADLEEATAEGKAKPRKLKEGELLEVRE